MFTCLPLLQNALAACEKVGILRNRIYLLDTPNSAIRDTPMPSGLSSLNGLIELGFSEPALAPLKLKPGEGGRRVAFLCYSSGTSGLPVLIVAPKQKEILANAKRSRKV